MWRNSRSLILSRHYLILGTWRLPRKLNTLYQDIFHCSIENIITNSKLCFSFLPPVLHPIPSIFIRFKEKMIYIHLICEMCFVITRKRSLGQGNIFTPVCHSVHRGEYLGRNPPGQVHPPAGTTPRQVHPPGPGTPPRPGTPPGQVPPGPGYTPPDQVHPPGAVHAGRYGQQAGGTHPTGMHSCYFFARAYYENDNMNE